MRFRPSSLRSDQLQYVWLIGLAVVVGVLSALGNLGFRALIALFTWLFRSLEWGSLQIPRGSFFLTFIPLVLASGGALLLALNYFFPGDVFGYGFPDFLAMVNLSASRIKRRWIFVKAAGAAISLGCGASVGREGPIAQIGGSIGSAVAQFAQLAGERARVLVACGAGAGIATTFNAPISGLMFAQEIVLLGETEVANLSLLVVATSSAVITSSAVLGHAAVFRVPQFQLMSYWELLSYLTMGVTLGVVAAGFIRFFHGASVLFQRSRLPDWAKLAVGLSIVGIVAILLPDNLSDGYPVINEALAGKLPVKLMLALSFAKIFACSVSLGCGAPGGVFGPIFFIGAMAGGTFRAFSQAMLPGLTGPRGSYALVGLGAFLAGTTHAPLTSVFLLIEMTRSYDITLPALMASILALVFARQLERESIDTYALAREGKTLQIGRERLVLTQTPVEAVMAPCTEMVSADANLPQILRHAGESSQTVLPVIGSASHLVGVIVIRDLVSLLASGEELGPLVNAYDLCQRDFARVTPQDNLDQTVSLMDDEGVDELPVVDALDRARVIGLIARTAIAQAFNQAAVSLSALASPGTRIFWSGGYRVARIEVPPQAKDKTVRQLRPRERFGVTVLALKEASNPTGGFTPVDPDRPLNTGDTLVAAGRPQSLRLFEQSLRE